MSPSNFAKVLQSSHMLGSQTMEIMNSEIYLKLLQDEYADLREKHANRDILTRDIRVNLNLADGLIIFTRFNNWADEESAKLIDMADSLVWEVIDVDPKKYSVDPAFTEVVGKEITELISHYKFDRMSCGARYRLPESHEIDTELSRLIRHMPGSTTVPERLRHAELHRYITPKWESSDSHDFRSAIVQIEHCIDEITKMDIKASNARSVLFAISEGAKRPDLDIHTTMARLYELKAILLLASYLLFDDKLTKQPSGKCDGRWHKRMWPSAVAAEFGGMVMQTSL
jgi:hypothetical protein